MMRFPNGLQQEHGFVLRKRRQTSKSTTAPKGVKRWAGLAAFALLVVLGVEPLAEWLEEGFSLLLELSQEGFESLFHKGFGFDAHHAQMATAYTLFLIGFALAALVLRKLFKLFEIVRRHGVVFWERTRLFWGGVSLNVRVWWEGLDRLNQCAAVVGFVLFAIPVFALLSLGMGRVIAEIL